MGLKVTEQDRRRVRSTAVVFTIIFIICAGLAALFLAITPRTEDITELTYAGKEEQITAMVDAHDGNTYFLKSKNFLAEYDAFTGEQLSIINLTELIKAKVAQKGAEAVRDSFNEWRISAFHGETNKYFIVTDNNGNMFKMEKNSKGEFVVADDFYLIEYNSDNSYNLKVIKGLDSIGNRMFSLIIENNYYYVEEYDMGNLTGPVKKKFLWDFGNGTVKKQVGDEEFEFVAIEALKSSTGILAFYAHEERIYIVKDGGDVMRLSTDLVDTQKADIDFFEDAAIASEQDVNEDEIRAAEEKAYKDSLIEKLADTCVRYVIEVDGKDFKINGVSVLPSQIVDANGNAVDKEDLKDKDKRAEVNLKTQELFSGFSKTELIAILDESELSSKSKTDAKTAANKQAEEVRKAMSQLSLDWATGYDKTTMKMYVHPDYLDVDSYASFSHGTSIIFGMILSKPNNALYYTDASEGYLYVLRLEDLDGFGVDGLLSDKAQKISNIHCVDDETFDNFGNGLSYNKYANTLYLKFANQRKVTIVDINDMDDYKEISSYTAAFRMHGLSGDEDNKVTHVLRQVVKVDRQGKEQKIYYACTYEPERFENKNVITVLFVVFLAIAIVTFLIGLWLWLNLRTEKGVKKVVFIAKDSKKNKFVYLALFFFIAMLIMFCYYEAIGAIAMSFFDYTKNEPAWIWNNFGNYVKIFNNEYFLSSIWNMLFFLVADIIISIVPPVIFAILLILIRNKVTSNWIRSLMFIPGIIPSMAAMLIWREGIYGDDGILNQIIRACGGTTVKWFLEESVARWSLLLMGFPFIGGYLIFYGGMMNIPTEYHEAGKLEGLGTIKRFLKIDIPLIMPQIKYIFITTFIASVQNFSRTYILDAPAVATPVHKMYVEMQEQFDYGMSSAWATLIFIFLFAAIATNFKMQKQDAMGADL